MPTEKPFEELNVEELRELMDVATAAKALGAKDPLPAGITIDSVQQRITELLDTGHYDDGHSFGWKQSDPDAGELDTGHYDDGHSFGWKQSDPGAGDATGSGVNWLAVGGILAAVVAAIVAFVLLMGGGDDADQKAASEDAAQVGADDDETTGPPEPSIVEMRATFAKPKTTYSVTVAPLERQYTYRWSFDGSRCGSFSDATKPTWVWDHPHTGEGLQGGAGLPGPLLHGAAIWLTCRSRRRDQGGAAP
ncbi:MAG: hypothetical protein HYU28_04130 [Actinobacteria bacterium]|nr:hypothetical protein [Actinomycetota bacterium]